MLRSSKAKVDSPRAGALVDIQLGRFLVRGRISTIIYKSSKIYIWWFRNGAPPGICSKPSKSEPRFWGLGSRRPSLFLAASFRRDFFIGSWSFFFQKFGRREWYGDDMGWWAFQELERCALDGNLTLGGIDHPSVCWGVHIQSKILQDISRSKETYTPVN